MKTLKIYLLFAICMIFLSSNIYAGMRGGHGPGFGGGPKGGDFNMPKGKWWRIPDIATKLNLTSDEQSKLDEMFYEVKKKMIDTHANIAKEKLELEQLIEKDSINDEACIAQFEKIVGVKSEMGIERFKFLLEVRKLLDKDRFIQLKESFKNRMNKKRGGPGCPYKGQDKQGGEEETTKRRGKRW